jgi:predicted nucleic acid-binding Zn ribbon protein
MLTNLLKLLPQLLRQAGESDEAREQAVFAAWAAAVGSQVRKATTPVRLERKTLIVAVPDDTWRAQMKRISGQALFKVNSLLGAPTVTTIEYVINPGLILSRHSSPQEVSFIAPDLQALPLRKDADRIPDPEVREAFLRAAGKCLDRQENVSKEGRNDR